MWKIPQFGLTHRVENHENLINAHDGINLFWYMQDSPNWVIFGFQCPRVKKEKILECIGGNSKEIEKKAQIS